MIISRPPIACNLASYHTTMTLLTLPATLWDLYVEYLWEYKPGSWVGSAASTFRVLAFLSILPFAILTLLVRLVSYVAPARIRHSPDLPGCYLIRDRSDPRCH